MHRIKLQGPWEFHPLCSVPTVPGVPLPAPGTVKFPAAWQDFLGDFRGRTRFIRPFNCPTNLDAHERVCLVLDGVGGSAVIRLNQQSVGQISTPQHTARFDISSLLQPHNRLEIEIDWAGTAVELGGLWASVALEIVAP